MFKHLYRYSNNNICIITESCQLIYYFMRRRPQRVVKFVKRFFFLNITLKYFLFFRFKNELKIRKRRMESPSSSQDERDIEVNVVSGASSPELLSSPLLDGRKEGRKSPYYDIKKTEKDSGVCTEKAAGSAPYTSFSISSILNRTEPRRETNVLEAALAAHHFNTATDAAMLSR